MGGRGRVMLVGSVAGTVGVRSFATYSSTKAYIRHFSRALRNDLRRFGVGITCLMPGATDTEFSSRADMGSAFVFKTPIARALGVVLSSREVAEIGVRGLLQGRAEVVPGLANQIFVVFAHWFPSLADLVGSMTFEPAPKWMVESPLRWVTGL